MEWGPRRLRCFDQGATVGKECLGTHLRTIRACHDLGVGVLWEGRFVVAIQGWCESWSVFVTNGDAHQRRHGGVATGCRIRRDGLVSVSNGNKLVV